MDVKKYITVCRVKKDIGSEANLARAIGQTPQNFSNKLAKGTLRATELAEIAEAMGCDLRFVDKATGEVLV